MDIFSHIREDLYRREVIKHLRNKHIIAKTKMAVIRMELQKSREIRCDPTGFFLCLQGDAHLIRKRQIFPRLADGL